MIRCTTVQCPTTSSPKLSITNLSANTTLIIRMLHRCDYVLTKRSACAATGRCEFGL
ncbi:hypothetical protein AG1IA_08855 [Rhizoctonia solani AG-1 IA]|uniref:Uncharacterized protein n=1 Tax=Thanatephorus cucumeris (strain AG1-IA) TaxID=983506 RepID=L8WJY0_THACA|nr:hypothetical protein AG1IA_08855 [Rhizoctonia solani AG-1 IA]